MQLPRVVVVSPSAFNLYSGTGVMLTNLFKGWPKEAICQVHGDALPEDNAVCDRFFRVGTPEMRWAFPLSLLQKNRSSEKAVSEGQGLRVHTGDSATTRWIKKVVSPEFPWNAEVSSRLAAWLDEFKPELVYVLPGGAYMRLAMQIAERWRVPIVSHMMDDWPSAPMGGGLGWAVRARLRSDLRRLFERSRQRFAISDSMADAYGRRYGGSFHVFQNPADVRERLPGARRSWTAGHPFRLVYIGSILRQGQLGSLVDVASAVQKLSDAGRPVRLDIYSPWSGAYPEELQATASVGLHPACEDKDVFDRLTSADLLVLPINFDSVSRRFIRYSMPAKIPLYLISGTPVLVYGPPESASVLYAESHGWGEVVKRRSAPALADTIGRLMDDEARRQAIGRRGIQVAQERHDAVVVRAAFQKELAAAFDKRLASSPPATRGVR